MCDRGAASGRGGTKLAMRRREEMKAMPWGIVSGAVTVHTCLPTARGSVVVIRVTQVVLHKAVDIEEGIPPLSKGASSAVIVLTRNGAIVKCAASSLMTKERSPQWRIIRVEVPGSRGEDTIPGVRSGGPCVERFTKVL